jgi:hypothetical protein
MSNNKKIEINGWKIYLCCVLVASIICFIWYYDDMFPVLLGDLGLGYLAGQLGGAFGGGLVLGFFIYIPVKIIIAIINKIN